jgi:hypothetical protein
VTFARAGERGRRPWDPRKAGRDRKGGILVLMFPGRFQGWLDDDLSNLPLIKGSKPGIAPERLGGVRMDR